MQVKINRCGNTLIGWKFYYEKHITEIKNIVRRHENYDIIRNWRRCILH